MKKKFLLFDMDRTLLDFAASERAALAKTFREYALPFSDEIYGYHLVNNAKLWEDYEKGLIDRETVLYTRFVRLFQHFGFEGDGVAFENSYRANLSRGHELMEGALHTVQTLAQSHTLYIVTNGVAETQRLRLHDSGLQPYFSGLFISEEIGSQKPQKAFFDVCFAHIPGFDATLALIIGDSLSSDILGGNNAGIDTCWFNPQGQANNTTAKPTTEIRRLTELIPLLAKN